MTKLKHKTLHQFNAGCGLRRAGYVYMYTNIDKYLEKYPMSYFVYDPPILVKDPAAFGLCAQGISYSTINGVPHAQDWIGASNYPNATDILTEMIEHNASGLIPLNPLIGNLIPGKSRRLLYHPNGYLLNAKAYRDEYEEVGGIDKCFLPVKSPVRKVHLKGNEMCASLHWQHVTGGTPNNDTRSITRKIGDTTYTAVGPITNVPAENALALIAWLPIDELHIVEGGDQERVDKAIDLLSKMSNLPVFLTNC